MPLSTFKAYRELARVRGYCEPWVPYVGKNYFDSAGPRFMYCGGAAWWASTVELPQDNGSAFDIAARDTEAFVSNGMYSTPFWRLYRSSVALMPWANSRPNEYVDSRVCWTNLTKTGMVQETAPPDKDVDLRHLDVAQLQYELDVLQPDILMCVSGSIVPSTGHEIFDRWHDIDGIRPCTESTWFRRSDAGTLLLWTMHPAFKPAKWHDSVLSDLTSLTEMAAASNG